MYSRFSLPLSPKSMKFLLFPSLIRERLFSRRSRTTIPNNNPTTLSLTHLLSRPPRHTRLVERTRFDRVPIESYGTHLRTTRFAHPGRECCVRVTHSRSLPFRRAKEARTTNRYFHNRPAAHVRVCVCAFTRVYMRFTLDKFHNYITEPTR